MNILTILGARPQFIKAAPVSNAFSKIGHVENILHTGQHYDDKMSGLFFRELGIPKPTWNLGVGSGQHGKQTGLMLMGIEKVIQKQRPDFVLVYGDTNSTLAGALAASKLGIQLVHVESGLRSFNRQMPEEHNRVLTDHCADVLFCPTKGAVDNLTREGIARGVHLVGDTMYDAILHFTKVAHRKSLVFDVLGIRSKEYILATVHRPSATDIPEHLESVLSAFIAIDEIIVFPVHPRTRKKIDQCDISLIRRLAKSKVKMIEPVGYLDMLALEEHSRLILTDSGGVQKEAYMIGVPCVTLRLETEWVETVATGWNVLVGNDQQAIVNAAKKQWPKQPLKPLFGDGRASERIAQILQKV